MILEGNPIIMLVVVMTTYGDDTHMCPVRFVVLSVELFRSLLRLQVNLV
jgi:hypothetical protein